MLLAPASRLAWALPMVMQGELTGNPVERFGDLSTVTLASPAPGSGWMATDTTLGPIGTAAFEYNAMGWRDDGFLYGLELIETGNTGLVVRIDPTTAMLAGAKLSPNFAGAPGWNAGTRYDAGDVNNLDDVLYLSTNNTALFMYSFLTNTMSQIAISGDVGYVADWAFNPATGLLYGADTQGQLATLNPVTGVRTDSAAIMGSGVAFGAAWHNPADGLLYFYRNQPTATGVSIYGVTSGGTVQNRWGAPTATLNDGAFVAFTPLAAPPAWGFFVLGLLAMRALGRTRFN
ncbi:MAG: hypothetical protein KDG50_02065 [Chromatiales bacterium]|nr:hypothetical protein [Chromatiales bacterium]